jgi:hypothetical protein
MTMIENKSDLCARMRRIYDLSQKLHDELNELGPSLDLIGHYAIDDARRIRDKAELLLDLASCEDDCPCQNDPAHGVLRA